LTNFFQTKEFLTLIKIRERLCVLNTSKNRDAYKETLLACKKLCADSFGSIGFNKTTGVYDWEKFDISLIGPDMDDMGDFETGMSYAPGWKLYLATNGERITLTHGSESISYEKEELEYIKDKSIKQMGKIHMVKIQFEGTVGKVGSETRNYNSEEDKRLSKYV